LLADAMIRLAEARPARHAAALLAELKRRQPWTSHSARIARLAETVRVEGLGAARNEDGQ
jgi:hypothetical protein